MGHMAYSFEDDEEEVPPACVTHAVVAKGKQSAVPKSTFKAKPPPCTSTKCSQDVMLKSSGGEASLSAPSGSIVILQSIQGSSKCHTRGSLSLETHLGDAVTDLESMDSLMNQISVHRSAIDLLHLCIHHLAQRTLVSVKVAQDAMKEDEN